MQIKPDTQRSRPPIVTTRRVIVAAVVIVALAALLIPLPMGGASAACAENTTGEPCNDAQSIQVSLLQLIFIYIL